MQKLFAIRHTPTGFYLPEPTGRSGRGGSFVEPVDCSGNGPNPRTFKSWIAANRALVQWVRGHHEGDHEYEDGYRYCIGAVVKPQPHRVKADMNIVPMDLIVQI